MGLLKHLSRSNLSDVSEASHSLFAEKHRPRPLTSRDLKQIKSERPCSRQLKKSPPTPGASVSLETKEEIKSRLYTALVHVLDLKQLALLNPEEAREEIIFALSPSLQDLTASWSLAEQMQLLEDICDTILGYGPLEPLLKREEISRVIVNSPSSTFIEISGKIQKATVRFVNSKQLLHVCRRLLNQVGGGTKPLNRISDERFPDGTRVNIVLPPISVEGPALTLHRANKVRFGFDQLVEIGAISQQARSLLEALCCARRNILISGGRSSGKTTLVNCLVNSISQDHRVIICGEAVGCDVRRKNIVYLEPRPQNFEGEGQVTMQDLVKNSLRSHPHHLVVDELRGSEAFDLLHALSAGQEGSIATIHSSSPQEALSRVEQMILTTGWLPTKLLREQVAKLFPIVVQTCQLEDGSRKVTSIVEVSGVRKEQFILNTLFTFEAKGKDPRGRIVGDYSFEPHTSSDFLRQATGEKSLLAAEAVSKTF